MRTIAIIAFLAAAPVHADPCVSIVTIANAAMSMSKEARPRLASILDAAAEAGEASSENRDTYRQISAENLAVQQSIAKMLDEIISAAEQSGCS